jgi:hypothetical protein
MLLTSAPAAAMAWLVTRASRQSGAAEIRRALPAALASLVFQGGFCGDRAPPEA